MIDDYEVIKMNESIFNTSKNSEKTNDNKKELLFKYFKNSFSVYCYNKIFINNEIDDIDIYKKYIDFIENTKKIIYSFDDLKTNTILGIILLIINKDISIDKNENNISFYFNDNGKIIIATF